MLFQYPYYPTGTGRGVWQVLLDWGLIDAFLPFMLIFVLLFATLQKIGLFTEGPDKPDRKINGLLAVIIAAMIVAPHVMGLYPRGTDPIIMIMQFLPHAGVLLVAILMVMFLLGLVGGKPPNLLLWAISLAALGILVFVILMAIFPGFFPTFRFLRDPAVQALLIVLLLMGLVGFFILKEPGQEGGFGKWIKEWLGEIT